jgi:L-fuculose-phosphate aldolase
MDTNLVVIGHVRSVYKRREDCPVQAVQDGPPADIVLQEGLVEGLQGMQAAQLLEIVTWMHLGDRSRLACHPRGDPANPLHGVFATRSPDRPNPIGLHTVRLLGLERNVLRVHPLEAVDGTPVVDIKPSLGGREAQAPWGPGISRQEGESIKRAAEGARERGLISGFNGNLSLRRGNEVIVTCAGSAKGHLSPGDLVCIDMQSGRPRGEGRVSSETPMHLALYRSQPRARAVVHTHPPHLLALSLQGVRDPIGVPLYEAGLFRDKLAQVPAIEPGTAELADRVAEAATTAQAVFMQRHGLVCWGQDPMEALALSEELESLARVHLLAGL